MAGAMLSKKCFFRSKYPLKPYAPQHLQRAEQDEQPHAFTEPSFVHVRVQPCRIEVRRHQLVAQLRGIMCRSLPQETGHVILHRPAPPALKSMKRGCPSLSNMTLRAWKSRYWNACLSGSPTKSWPSPKTPFPT